MSELIGEDNIREYLTAFADGELEAAQILAVLDYLAENPEGLQIMRTQQRLRLAADRAVRKLTPPMPEELRRRIEAMAAEITDAPAAPPRSRSGGIGWRLPAVAAACLLAGVLLCRALSPPPARTQPPPVLAQIDTALPAVTVAHAQRVHADCSRLQDGLHAAQYPTELKGVADSVAKDLLGTRSHPDLSKIGYAFIGAGPCAAPLTDTAHLLYQSTGPEHKGFISVFVQQQKGQFDLEPGKLYVVSGPLSPFPMYAWRTERVVYFLIADSEPVIREARQEIAIAPRP